MINLFFVIFSLLFLVLECLSKDNNDNKICKFNDPDSCISKDITQVIKFNFKDGSEDLDTVFTRILNADTVIGSKPSSASGIIYSIDSEVEFSTFINNSKLSGKFAVILPAVLFNRANIRKLEESKKVAGVVVIYDDKPITKPYSPDKKCPNCEYGMYADTDRANYKWNPYGDGMIFESFDIPIFGITGNGYSITEVILPIIEANVFNRIRKYKEYPLYSLKFDSFMYASKDSRTCLQRKTCDPIGGNSVWGSFSKTINSDDGKKIIFVTAQLDGNSVFHENTIGTNSQIGGIVANLAIADALSRSDIKPDQFQNHIVFMFFNGESYGYGGSQRFVNDISQQFNCVEKEKRANNQCSNNASCQKPYMYFDDFKNITLDNIKGIIELSQLTCSGCDDINHTSYFMHVDDEKDEETLKITNLISKVYSVYGNSIPVSPVTTNNYDNNDNNVNNVNNDNIDNNDNNVNNDNIDNNNLTNNNTNNTEITTEGNENKNKLKRQDSTSYIIKPAWEGIPKNLGLPPASSQSFLKVQKIPAVVISDFQTEFTNKYYHSGFDVDSDTTVYNNTLCKTADIIAKTIWLYAQNKESDTDISSIPASVTVDCNYINELMYCLSHDISCPLVQTLLTSNNSTYSNREVEGILTKVSHYSGIFNDYSLNGTLHTYSNFDSWITNFALIKSIGRNTSYPCEYIDDCTKKFEHPEYDELNDEAKAFINSEPFSKRKYQCIDHFCIEGQAFVHPAYGTGIKYDESNNMFFVKNSSQPTWTESRWSKNTITICFTTSRSFQFLELFIGIVCVVLTVLGYYFINNYTRKHLKLV